MIFCERKINNFVSESIIIKLQCLNPIMSIMLIIPWLLGCITNSARLFLERVYAIEIFCKLQGSNSSSGSIKMTWYLLFVKSLIHMRGLCSYRLFWHIDSTYLNSRGLTRRMLTRNWRSLYYIKTKVCIGDWEKLKL